MRESIINSESFYEAILKQAVINDYLRELESLPTEQELEKTLSYSPRHVTRMKKLFASETRREYSKKFFSTASKAVAVAAIVLGILFSFLMLNSDVRAVVVDTIVEWFETFTRFQSPQSERETFNPSLRPSYVPESFMETLVHEDRESSTVTVVYENDSNIIVFNFAPIDTSLSVNNEDVEFRVITEDGVLFYLFESADEVTNNNVVWEYDGLRFSLVSTISIDTLLHMAQSLL